MSKSSHGLPTGAVVVHGEVSLGFGASEKKNVYNHVRCWARRLVPFCALLQEHKLGSEYTCDKQDAK